MQDTIKRFFEWFAIYRLKFSDDNSFFAFIADWNEENREVFPY